MNTDCNIAFLISADQRIEMNINPASIVVACSLHGYPSVVAVTFQIPEDAKWAPFSYTNTKLFP